MPRQITKVGKYTVIDRIARGGMGAVYKAKHPTLKRYVILKQLILRGGSGFIQRFKREASLMIDFKDEHIVQVYDHFKEGSSYYIVMEYVDGISLDKLIEQRGFLSSEVAALIFIEICKGLKYAHDKDVIHRDIKPANILISRDGEIKLVDFGIATSKESDDDGLTKAGMTLGTPSYMSPEQITDTRKVDKRADIYSMGVVLYEMVTGQKPFPSSFTREAIHLINKGSYKNPKKLNPSIPNLFRGVIRKTMNHNLAKRYKDVQQVINKFSKYTRRYVHQREINTDIQRYLSGTEIELPVTLKLRKKTRNLVLKFIVGLIFAGLLVVGGLFVYNRGYYYEYLKSREYGSLEIQASVPEGYYKKLENVYALINVISLNSGSGEEPFTYNCRLEPQKASISLLAALFVRKEGEEEKGTEERNILTTNKIYLPAGNYNLELYLESQKFVHTFYLNPRLVQKQDVKTYDQKTMRFDLRKEKSKPVTLFPDVFDSKTGESIYKAAKVSLYLEKEKKWIDWKKYNKSKRLRGYLTDSLRSGRSYSFKFSAPSYFPETVRCYVEHAVDTARIAVTLTKKPGKLILKSDYEGLELLIDNRKENYLGEKDKEFVRYGVTDIESREFLLPDGNYVLTVKKGKKLIENYQFNLKSDSSIVLDITYNEDDKKILIHER
jgi:serine/threonine-protein kinase